MHLFSLFIVTIIVFPFIQADQISFIGPTNTLSSWNDPTIWNTHTIPTSQDTVILPSHAYIRLNSATNISTLIVNSGATLYFDTSDPFADLPILSMKGLTFGSTPITSPIVLDGVILEISSLIDTSSITSISNSTILVFQNFGSLSLLSTGIAHIQSSSPIIIEFSDASSVFNGQLNIVGDVTMNGAVQLNNIEINGNSSLTVNGEFGIFSGATTLGPSSSLNFRSKCSIDTNATFIGSSTSFITFDGIHHIIGTIHLNLPIIILSGVTTFTQTVDINHVSIQSNATLAIDNNATISSLTIYDNATIGTFSITQSHASIVVNDINGIFQSNHLFNIYGVNLISMHNISMISSAPINIELFQNATWVWYDNSIFTSPTDVIISTPDNSDSHILPNGNITIPTLTIHVCWNNITNHSHINGQLIVDTPSSLICIVNTIIPTVLPTTFPTEIPTGQPIQGTSSTGIYLNTNTTNTVPIHNNRGLSSYHTTWNMMIASLIVSLLFHM